MDILIKILWSIPIWIASGILGCLTRVAIDKFVEYFNMSLDFLDWNSRFTALKWVEFLTSIIYIIFISLWMEIFDTWDLLYIFNLFAFGSRILYLVATGNIKNKKARDEDEMRQITLNTIRVMEEMKESNIH